jgi:hypothetical protein
MKHVGTSEDVGNSTNSGVHFMTKQHISFGTAGRSNTTKLMRGGEDVYQTIRTPDLHGNWDCLTVVVRKRLTMSRAANTNKRGGNYGKAALKATSRSHARFLLACARKVNQAESESEKLGQAIAAKHKVAAKIERKAYKSDRDRIARVNAFLTD